jgi:hypothetical protein
LRWIAASYPIATVAAGRFSVSPVGAIRCNFKKAALTSTRIGISAFTAVTTPALFTITPISTVSSRFSTDSYITIDATRNPTCTSSPARSGIGVSTVPSHRFC